MRFVLPLLAADLALSLAGGSSASATKWKLHDLGALLHLNMGPTAINDSGVIVGSAYGSTREHAFLWRNGNFVDLGWCGEDATAASVNAQGEVVGTCGRHAFLRRDGKTTSLGTGGWDSSDAVAINDRGQIIGNRWLKAGEHAFLWQNGEMRDLGTLGGTKSEATALNARGDVVGDSTTASGQQHAFLWRTGKMTDLGTLAGAVANRFGGVANEQFEPHAINAHDVIVGLAHDPIGSYETAFIWRNGKLSGLPALGSQPSRAIAVNDRGQVLVRTTPPSDKRGDTYVWQKGKLKKLPAFDPDQAASFATALDASGDVVGTSLVAIAHLRPFVWTNGRMIGLPTLGGTGPPAMSVVAVSDRGVIVGARTSYLVIWTH
jgi:probable HAF family extracellular repeat protein